jgi:hypothetical protein
MPSLLREPRGVAPRRLTHCFMTADRHAPGTTSFRKQKSYARLPLCQTGYWGKGLIRRLSFCLSRRAKQNAGFCLRATGPKIRQSRSSGPRGASGAASKARQLFRAFRGTWKNPRRRPRRLGEAAPTTNYAICALEAQHDERYDRSLAFDGSRSIGIETNGQAGHREAHLPQVFGLRLSINKYRKNHGRRSKALPVITASKGIRCGQSESIGSSGILHVP